MASNGVDPTTGAPRFPEEDAPQTGADYEEVADFAAFLGTRPIGPLSAMNDYDYGRQGFRWFNTTDGTEYIHDGTGFVVARPRYARLAKSADQSTSPTPNAVTAVEWNSDSSSDGLWSNTNSTTRSRIRLTKPGLWDVSASLRAASTIYARVRLNGSGGERSEFGGTYVSPRDLFLCTNPATDYVDVGVLSAAASVAIETSYCSFRAVYLGS